MKTRSQAKKEQKIPKLNEDIFGIILKHVIRMEQDRVMKSFEVISNHFGHGEDYYSTPYYSYYSTPYYILLPYPIAYHYRCRQEKGSAIQGLHVCAMPARPVYV